jgi:beta-glucanase (GH16 family)
MTRLYLPVSGTPTIWYAGYATGMTLYGTTGNDQLAANAPDITLVGDGGDDIFIVYDPSDVVIETPNSGVSTIETWGAGYTLPANVQNLTLEGSADAYAVGNSLNNIITANAGNDSITAGTGNDILIGGSGNDTFLVAAGDGQDEIQNFRSADVVALQGFSFTSFADVQAAMTESGTDTVLNLGNGQSITFDNTTTGSFTAGEFNIPADPPAPVMSFDDEFNSLSLNIGGLSGAWNTTFSNGARSLYSNNEGEAYLDPAFSGTSSQPLGIDPFSISNGVLTITAQPTDPAMAAYFGNVGAMPYTSGLLTSYGTFSQTYGYWEVRAQIPSGDGLWPAFWLLPANNSWPPEVDIMEVYGNNPGTVYNSYHSMDGSAFMQPTYLGDLSSGFHTYGFNWTPSTMTWYVDGSQTAQIATPADMNTPMYMLINLAVGGNWGWPDATTQFPANFRIDYVHVYSLSSGVFGPQAAAPPDPPAAPSGLILDSLTDSGVKGDNITNVTRPEIDGQGVAGDTVTLYDGTAVVGTGMVGSNGNWQIITSALANGAHSLTATQTDSAGNVSASSAPLSLSILPASVPEDLDGNGLSDLVFQNASTGQLQSWELNGTSVLASGTIGTPSSSDWQLAGIGDLNGDGRADLVLQNTSTGQIQGYEMNGASVISSGTIGTPSSAAWHVADIGDLNGDGRADLILQNTSTGEIQGWEMYGTSVIASGVIGTPSDAGWKLAGVADLNDDGCSDLIFQNASSGQVWAWEMNGTSVIAGANIGTPSDASWKLAAIGSLRGDGHTDLIFQSTGSGQVWDWETSGTSVVASGDIGTPSSPNWKLTGLDNPNSDGHPELVFQNSSDGQVWGWEMNGASVVGGAGIGLPGAAWHLGVG